MSQQIHWDIKGMTCSGCVNKVTSYLESKGMDEVIVDLAGGSIDFTLSHQDHDLIQGIQEGVERLGYSVGSESGRQGWSIGRKLAVSALFTIPLMLLHFFHLEDANKAFTINLLLSIVPVSIGLYHFGKSAINSIIHGHIDMDILIFIGGFSATLYSLIGYVTGNVNYDFFETAASIFTIVLFGNWIESKAIGRTREFINKLNDEFPKEALVIHNDVEKLTDLSKIGIGDIVRLRQGDIIPLDGKVTTGMVEVDESMISGESEWIKKAVDETLFSGSRVYSGSADMRVHSLANHSTLQSILSLVRKAEKNKPGMQRIADKVSAVFVPLVLAISLLTFLIAYFGFDIAMSESIMRSIAVLVISCPCALGLATPAAVAVGISEALKKGILIKRADVMEKLIKAKYYILDKTGTLTQPTTSVTPIDGKQEEYLPYLKALIEKSEHPLAISLRAKWPVNGSPEKKIHLVRIEEVPGKGIEGQDASGRNWKLGSRQFVHISGNDIPEYRSYLSLDEKIVAGLSAIEEASDAVFETVAEIQKIGETVILSGDRTHKVLDLANRLKVKNAKGDLSPEDKLDLIKEFAKKDITLMVGDGINDSAAMSAAHIGISMNDSSKVVASSADVVLTGKRFEKLSQLIKISKNTVQNIRQNILWAFAYNIVAIPMAAMGIISPMWAAMFMASSDVVIIANAIRFKLKSS